MAIQAFVSVGEKASTFKSKFQQWRSATFLFPPLERMIPSNLTAYGKLIMKIQSLNEPKRTVFVEQSWGATRIRSDEIKIPDKLADPIDDQFVAPAFDRALGAVR